MLIICEPKSESDFVKYYQLRYDILRKPWNQPPGSEKDKDEKNSFHFMIKNNFQEVLAVCRLQTIDNFNAQLRYMAVREDMQQKGLGKKLLEHAENKMRQKQLNCIILHARENAIAFYKNSGYSLIEPSYTLYDSIHHYLMQKKLA